MDLDKEIEALLLSFEELKPESFFKETQQEPVQPVQSEPLQQVQPKQSEPKQQPKQQPKHSEKEPIKDDFILLQTASMQEILNIHTKAVQSGNMELMVAACSKLCARISF